MKNLVLEKVNGIIRMRYGNILVKNFDGIEGLELPLLLHCEKSSLEEIANCGLSTLLDNSKLNSRDNFTRIGLISPYGTVSGEPMSMSIPNFGLLAMQEKLNQSQNIDCIYLDPNLVGLSKLNQIINERDFDIVGFSILNTTFRNDLPLILNSKRSCKAVVLGGPTIETFSEKDLLDCLGVQYLVVGDGIMALEKIANGLRTGKREKGVIKEKYRPGQRAASKFEILDEKFVDCIQEQKYKASYIGIMDGNALPYNCAGINPLRIKISDECAGKCVFCSVSKHNLRPAEPEELIKLIKSHAPLYDSIEFEDHEFTFYEDVVARLCEMIISNNLAPIPKQCCTRADSINSKILRSMSSAGMRIINYGIESFDQGVLDYLSKGTRENQNLSALNQTLNAGIKPGINLILFSPVESTQSLEKNVARCAEYLSRGATLNIVNRVTVSIGDKLSKDERYRRDVVGQEVFLEGMNAPLFLPSHLRINHSLEGIYDEMLNFSQEFCSALSHVSVHTRSASYILGLSKILRPDLYGDIVHSIEKSMQAESAREITWKK